MTKWEGEPGWARDMNEAGREGAVRRGGRVWERGWEAESGNKAGREGDSGNKAERERLGMRLEASG